MENFDELLTGLSSPALRAMTPEDIGNLAGTIVASRMRIELLESVLNSELKRRSEAPPPKAPAATPIKRAYNKRKPRSASSATNGSVGHLVQDANQQPLPLS
jgi:hypothetical protein